MPTGTSSLIEVTTATPDAKRPETSEPPALGLRHRVVAVDDAGLTRSELEVPANTPRGVGRLDVRPGPVVGYVPLRDFPVDLRCHAPTVVTDPRRGRWASIGRAWGLTAGRSGAGRSASPRMGDSTQNSLPSGSASTAQPRSPSRRSLTSVAPSPRIRSISSSRLRSVGRRQTCIGSSRSWARGP